MSNRFASRCHALIARPNRVASIIRFVPGDVLILTSTDGFHRVMRYLRERLEGLPKRRTSNSRFYSLMALDRLGTWAYKPRNPAAFFVSLLPDARVAQG